MNSITLRGYQQSAVDAALGAVSNGCNPVIALPTGSGKSLCLAAICADLPGRKLVLSHRKELLLQDMAALNRYAPNIATGIYSAGLDRRDVSQKVIFAGVASAFRKLPELQCAGEFSAVMVDECHLIAPRGEGVMYRAILDALPDAPRIGLSATPYRLDSGMLHEGDGAWFDVLCAQTKPSDLVAEGWLSPVVGIGARESISTDGVHRRAGEFVASELSQIACNDELVNASVREMLTHAEGRRKGIVFAIDVAHAQMLLAALLDRGETAFLITGKTPANERDTLLRGFNAGRYRWCVNVNVLTTGFDSPGVDCVVMMRPTLSKALYVQAVGRGMRKADGKTDCLLIDFGRNVARHGSLDMLASYRQHKTSEEEEQAREAVRKARQAQEKQYRHAASAFTGDPMTGATSDLCEVQVIGVKYFVRPAKKNPNVKNLVAVYDCGDLVVRQWICLEYPGKARWHAEQWFARRGLQAPRKAELGRQLADAAPTPQSLSIRFDQDFGGMPKVEVEHFADPQHDLPLDAAPEELQA